MASAAARPRRESARAAEPLDTARLASLLYLELRRIARWRLAGERARHSLQPTGLTHEAILRLLGDPTSRHWDSRGHFVAAVSQAMRRIIVEEGRRRDSQKRGGRFVRHDIALAQVADNDWSETLAVDDLLEKLAAENAEAARVVELRYFAGLTVPETAVLLGISRRTVDRRWEFARAWLRHELHPTRDDPAAHAIGDSAGRRRLPR
jgi:RNA polymerase sigma factor (TIGR02999 family)